ncbi:MAG: hypothetical protein M3552_07035 [Planctomycetota bacterium]|nr:hypothetical protein [Planctomycetota bacterium]
MLVSQAAGTAGGAEIDQDLLTRLQTEGRVGWDAWDQQSRHIEAEFTETRWLWQPDGTFKLDPGNDWVFHYFYDDGRMRRALVNNQADGRAVGATTVFRVADYAFEAEQANGSALVATEVRRAPRAAELAIAAPLQFPYSIQFRDLRELIDNPRFRITQIRQENQTVRVDFRYDMEGDQVPLRFRSGHVVLMPQLHWAVRSYEILSANTAEPSRFENEFGPADGNFIPLIRSTRRFTRGKVISTNESWNGNKEVWEFRTYRPNSKPDSFYTFEAVGLPNLARQSSGWGVWFWVINAGIVCLLAAWWLRRRLVTGRY